MEIIPYIIAKLQFLFLGYGASTLIFGIFSKISRLPADNTKRYISFSNIIASYAGLLLVITLICDLIRSYNITSDINDTYFAYRLRIFIPFILLAFAASMFSLSKKLREKWIISLLMALVFNICVTIENVFILWTSLFRDYLPSSWSYYRDFGISFWLNILLYATVYFIIVIITMRLQRVLATNDK
ncbi:hypothetical protein SAMN04488505_11133 [Chitinophaga rupis]|uniref:Uncharacterized protein n=1 Tax=Chitinophaga rupis TaxID=573321 RepID=A0A1H8HEK2_9BACT|nr:hypothetical protein [Chitinophaga rupis]SEN53978.1 hypothetical protein SAMN04488505_11133 [Chitinophaga rupis]